MHSMKPRSEDEASGLSDQGRMAESATAPTLADDAIARSKRILVLVDAYTDRPDSASRTALRVALVEEFAQARTLGRGDFSEDDWQLMQQALADYIESKKSGKVRSRMAALWQRLRERV